MNTDMVLMAAQQGILDGLKPWQLLLASFALLLLAGVIYFVNKTKLEGESFVAELAALLCAFAGLFGLYRALFGG